MRNLARYFWKWFTPRCRLFQENQVYKKHRGSKPKIKKLFIIMIRFDFQRPKEENIIAIFKVESSLKWSRYTIDYLIHGDGGPFLNRNPPPLERYCTPPRLLILIIIVSDNILTPWKLFAPPPCQLIFKRNRPCPPLIWHPCPHIYFAVERRRLNWCHIEF